jgi:hypothetical protein
MDRRDFLQFATGLIAIRFLMTQTSAQNSPKRHSMKGWELYSWQDQKSWKFSILIGTNRNKKLEEIKAPAVVLHSLKELKQALSELAKGEYLTWDTSSFDWLKLPPLETVQTIHQRCKTLGLVLQITSKTSR